MLYRAQEFHAVALLLQGVVRRGRALDGYAAGLELKGLLCVRRQHQRAVHYQRRADVLMGDLIIIFKRAALKHDLQRLEAASVVKLDKAKILHVADGPDPAAYCHALPAECGGIGKNARYLLTFHKHTLL